MSLQKTGSDSMKMGSRRVESALLARSAYKIVRGAESIEPIMNIEGLRQTAIGAGALGIATIPPGLAGRKSESNREVGLSLSQMWHGVCFVKDEQTLLTSSKAVRYVLCASSSLSEAEGSLWASVPAVFARQRVQPSIASVRKPAGTSRARDEPRKPQEERL
jgi:hypothetical protein